jgi:hypothetical protein
VTSTAGSATLAAADADDEAEAEAELLEAEEVAVLDGRDTSARGDGPPAHASAPAATPIETISAA